MTNSQTIPKLRFSKFIGEWETKPVGELCDCVVPGRNRPQEFSGEIPWITTPDFQHNEEIKVSRSGLAISRAEAKRVGSRIVVKDSVVISCVGELGLVAIAAKDIVINQQLHAFLPSETVVPRFLLYSLSMRTRFMDRVATKTAVPYMNKENCNSIPVIYPPVPEQRKIAEFLTAVDGRISQLSQKKALLEAYKKGVMQQLFTHALRFKDDHGNDFPEWEEKTLGSVAKLYQPKTISQTDLTLDGYTVYGANGIIGKYHSYNHEKSQVTVTCRGSTCGVINLTGPFSWITGNAMVVNLDEQPDSTKEFVYHALCATDLRYLITGSGQPQITGNLKGHVIGFPSLPEQTKIANFLTAVDRKIEAVAAQIAHTQTWKKGLLQQMFV